MKDEKCEISDIWKTMDITYFKKFKYKWKSKIQ